MAWILSPTGIGVIVGIIFTIASLIYWQREAIKKQLRRLRKNVSEIEISIGPLKFKLGRPREAETRPIPHWRELWRGR